MFLINPKYPRLVGAEATLQEAEEALERHARQMVSRSVNSLQYRTLNLRPWGGFELFWCWLMMLMHAFYAR